MSADMFTVLAPLATLPLVILCVFIGCSVPNIEIGPSLIWLGGEQSDIASIAVAFGLDSDDGENPSTLHPPAKVLTGAALDEFFVNGLSALSVGDWAPWPDGGSGTFNCACTITQKQTSITAQISATALYNPDGDYDVAFELWRDGLGFGSGDFVLANQKLG
jgi:hypothetical protein